MQNDEYLVGVQRRLGQLMYRYLASLHSEDNSRSVADQKTRMLLSLIEDLHDCADIMYNSNATTIHAEKSMAGEAALDQRVRQWDQEVLDIKVDT